MSEEPLINGFLPDENPLKLLNTNDKSLNYLHEITSALPKLLLTNQIRLKVKNLNFDSLDIRELSQRELKCLNVQLSFLAHAYIWGDKTPSTKLPSPLSELWVKVSNNLGRPPVLSYASYCLDNWHKIDPNKDISLDNVALNYNFLGGIDEDWFVTIHICIEYAARGAISSTHRIVHLLLDDSQPENIKKELVKILESLQEVNFIFRKMPDKCDPYIYYHRVRPYIFGWKNNPALPNGLIYENCFDDVPQLFRGETGAQSSIIPTLDALFNVKHERDELRDYLDEMKNYMPPEHRKFIDYVESNSKLSEFIEKNQDLQEVFDLCLSEISAFRSQHLQYASDYIHKQNTKNTLFGTGGSVVRGTGGTPFMRYLKKHRDETDKSKNRKS